MAIINLRGLDRAAVLAALYNASKPQGLGFLNYEPKPMTIGEAKELLSITTDFDYLNGRVMKINLSGDTLETRWFDCDNGEGAAEDVIKTLQETLDPNNAYIRKAHSENTLMSASATKARINKETTISREGNLVTVNLGLADVKDILEPKINEAVKAQGDK